jgi:DNA primase
MARIPEDLLERIRDATDIAEIVSEHVQLTAKGRNLFGLCPFHNENSPSFSVNPERQIYHCFGCGVGGNVFKFIQEIDRVSFVEAVKFLANRTNIPLPANEGPSHAVSDASDQIYRANDLAHKYFHHMLLNDTAGEEALAYLRNRRLSDETIERFGLGYAPAGWDGLLKVASRRGFSPQAMEQAGLALPRQSGNGYYDRFRDRAVFPIANLSNRTIGFGARALQTDQEPKYLNSPETTVYHKGTVLYGLAQTRDAIRRRDAVIVVEGYMDLLSLVQAGIEHVVATSGTALTEEHCRSLARYAHRVVLLFDGDTAGSNAAMRGLEILLGTGVDARVVSLPSEHDPDTFVQEKGPEALLDLAEKGYSALDFYMRQIGLQHDLNSVQGKSQAIETLKPLLARPRDAVRRDLMLREVAQRLSVDESALRQEMSQVVQRQQRPRTTATAPTTPAAPLPEPPHREREFVGLLLQYPHYISATAETITAEALDNPQCQELIRVLFERFADVGEIDLSLLMDQLENETLTRLVSQCAMLGFAEEQVEEQWRQSVAFFQRTSLQRRIQQARQALNQAEQQGDENEVLRISGEIVQLNQERQHYDETQNS